MNKILYRQEYEKKNRLALNAYKRQYQATTKLAVLSLFGSKCHKCGFDDPRALQIDHINQAGKTKWRSGTALYRAIISGKRPIDDLQCLCANCNWIKRAENNETRILK